MLRYSTSDILSSFMKGTPIFVNKVLKYFVLEKMDFLQIENVMCSQYFRQFKVLDEVSVIERKDTQILESRKWKI
jgi:hypothetical protein